MKNCPRPVGRRAPVEMELNSAWEGEAHVIRVAPHDVGITAGGIEGWRRAVYWMQDMMRRHDGPFLPIGEHHRDPVIKTRLSRCFFGPINRPPRNRDELADKVDYYPPAYLETLAEEGANALWISIRFRDTVPSRLFPWLAPDADARLAKLNQTVRRCKHYGIRIFVFCIEPEARPLGDVLFTRYPRLKGHALEDCAAFCTATSFGKRYLEEAALTLFRRVPDLGGLILIPVGERLTQCASIEQPAGNPGAGHCNCPRCRSRDPDVILAETLRALRRGMDQSNPAAELISWPYGQWAMWGERRMVESARHVPEGVILQHNFETGGNHMQLGKERPLWDYWLSVAGPSPCFRKAAMAARRNGTRVSAKLQVGCSHEIATVPHMPVPGLLYRKYRAMRDIEVSVAMQSWYFGNNPSLMTKAAALLSFDPFPPNEDAFLRQLADLFWGKKATKVAKAWGWFTKAYANYPANHLFGYYGPMHDGITWPLHLLPKNQPLAPTWRLDFPPGGDYLPDCLSSYFNLDEVLALCRTMAALWKRGCAILNRLGSDNRLNTEQRHQRDVANAIGMLFESGLAILRFYQLREFLVEATPAKARRLLRAMESLVHEEIARRKAMLRYLPRVPDLGFHAEAEGFKITPREISKSIAALGKMLGADIPYVRERCDRNNLTRLFGAYTGERPACAGIKVPCVGQLPRIGANWAKAAVISLVHVLGESDPRYALAPVCKVAHDGKRLFIQMLAPLKGRRGRKPPSEAGKVSVMVDILPHRMHPRIQFTATLRDGPRALLDDGYLQHKPPAFKAAWQEHGNHLEARLVIPHASAMLSGQEPRFRMNIRLVRHSPTPEKSIEYSWMRRVPLPQRHVWEDANPATDYGWVSLQHHGASARPAN